MAKFKPKGKASKGNISILGTTLGFLIIGIILVIISYGENVIPWLKTTGIVLLVIAVPVLIWIVHNIIIEKIKDM
jgi:Na+/melibiose symporter-like transporter